MNAAFFVLFLLYQPLLEGWYRLGHPQFCTDPVPSRLAASSGLFRCLVAELAPRTNRPDLLTDERAGDRMRGCGMADVRVVVIESDELARLIAAAVRSAIASQTSGNEWVDARTSGLGRRLF